jgi:hypothetical protein
LAEARRVGFEAYDSQMLIIVRRDTRQLRAMVGDDLGKEDVCQAISDWLNANPDAPEIARLALEHYTTLIETLEGKARKIWLPSM